MLVLVTIPAEDTPSDEIWYAVINTIDDTFLQACGTQVWTSTKNMLEEMQEDPNISADYCARIEHLLASRVARETRRCKACKHWEPDPQNGPGVGKCEGGHVNCWDAMEPKDRQCSDRIDTCGNGLCAVWTGPDFGCVHWELKETP